MSKAIDRAIAFKNEVSGQSTYKIVCKASNHDLAGPKKKHVDSLLRITNDPRSQMSFVGDLISERLKDKNWVVVFKTLIVAHNLMTLGHENFVRCMATRSQIFVMDDFHDRTDFLSTEMSTHLRRYGKYLACLCSNYKALAVDISRIPKGENSPFKKMDPVKVLKAADLIQKQLDRLLEIEMTSEDLTNGVVNTAFLMLYKDLVKLYAAYNDCMINLLEKFFEMKKAQCRETIEFYRRFLTRQEGVQTFLKLAERVGIDKQTHLNLRQVPEDLLPALENHLSEMDSLRKANSGDASPSIRAASEKLAALKSAEKKKVTFTDSETKSPSSESLPSANTDVLEAQRKRFEELKRQASGKSLDSSATSQSTPAKEFASPNTSQSSGSDLLGLDIGSAIQSDPWSSSPQKIPSAAPSNPFEPVSSTTLAVGNGTATNDPWGGPQAPSAYQEVDLFSEIRGDSGRGSIGVVFNSPSQPFAPSQSSSQFTLGGDILQPQAAGPLASKELLETPKSMPGLAQDVDSSLAKAAANLSVDLGGGGVKKVGIAKKTEHMWTPPKESVKTGGTNFQKQTLQARTLPAQVPPPGGMGGGAPVNWNKGMHGGHFPVNQYPGQQPMGAPMNPMGAPMGAPMNPMMGYPQQPYGMQPGPMMQPQWGYPGQQPQQRPQQPNDPFGTIPSQNTPLF